MKKKTKILVSILASTMMFAMAGISTGCGTKDWFEENTCKHTYDKGQVVSEATCTESGLIKYTCKKCDHEKTEKVKAFGHTPVMSSEKEPTCIEPGLTVGVVCSVCDEVLTEQIEVPATGECLDDNNDSYCDTCGYVCFEFYQDEINYIAEEYVAQSSLNGNVVRLHVGTINNEGMWIGNSFPYVPGDGTINLRYNCEKDVIDYIYTGAIEVNSGDGYGEITHDDVQYFAFEEDGEYYVDVYFDDSVTLSLLAGYVSTNAGETMNPLYKNVGWGYFKFIVADTVQILKINCKDIDENGDSICDKCGKILDIMTYYSTDSNVTRSNAKVGDSVVSNCYRLFYVGADVDSSKEGYDIWGSTGFSIYDPSNENVWFEFSADSMPLPFLSIFYCTSDGDRIFASLVVEDDERPILQKTLTSTNTVSELICFLPGETITFRVNNELVTVDVNNLLIKEIYAANQLKLLTPNTTTVSEEN